MNHRRQFIKNSALASIGLSVVSIPENPTEQTTETHETESLLLGKNYHQVHFLTSADPDVLTLNGIRIFRRIVLDRTGVDTSETHKDKLNVRLNMLSQSLPAESFRIEHEQDGMISITASDGHGMLFGIGKLLHTGQLSSQGFMPGQWSGLSVPEKAFRAIYFATHFHNFYHDAPIEKVLDYIEELVLWGYNGLVVWFDMHHYEGIKDAKAQDMLDRLSLLLKAGKSVGMKTMLTMLANEGYNSSPIAVRATTPLQIRLRGEYGVEICPSLPGGTELILKQVEEEIDAFSERGIKPDTIGLWPYDQGGCGCTKCTPWGSNGYLKLTKLISDLARKKLPGVKIIQSTWLYDVVEDEGEWEGLAAAFKKEKPWVDYILADSHEEYPKYLLSNPVPGNVPLLNFPEISMWESYPWGGYGANPLPQRFQGLWNSVRDKVAGGYPYSEGIFEDLNKVLYSSFYWNSRQPVSESLKEYVSFEYSASHAGKIIEAIHIMEKNHGLGKYSRKDPKRKFRVPKVDHGAEKAYRLLTEVDHVLPEKTRKLWRWRILLLRAMFDHELRRSGGIANDKILAGFKELSDIFYAKNADDNVRPPLT
jgi:hypothetical protein